MLLSQTVVLLTFTKPVLFPGARDAANAGLQRCPNANAHNGTIHGRPPTVTMETTRHGHDGQVQAALG